MGSEIRFQHLNEIFAVLSDSIDNHVLYVLCSIAEPLSFL